MKWRKTLCPGLSESMVCLSAAAMNEFACFAYLAALIRATAKREIKEAQKTWRLIPLNLAKEEGAEVGGGSLRCENQCIRNRLNGM